MESLALLVTLIIAISILGGPLSFLLSFLYVKNARRHSRKHRLKVNLYFVLTLLFSIPAILVGFRFLTLDISIGGRVVGVVGVLTGSLAIYKSLRFKLGLR